MKKIVIGLILSALLFTSGCYGPKDARKSEVNDSSKMPPPQQSALSSAGNDDSQSTTSDGDNSKLRADLVVKLKKEIQEAFDIIYDSEQENLILEVETTIKLNKAIALLEDGDPEKADLIQKQKNLRMNLEKSLVYTGTTKSGVNVIAIKSPPLEGTASSFEESANKIRGDANEVNFLRDLGNDTSTRAEVFYGIDVYVEGLISPKSSYKVENVFDNVPGSTVKAIEHPEQYSAYINDMLSKYKRKVDDGNTIDNKQWKLYIYEGFSVPSTISLTIDGEDVLLVQ